MNKLKNKIKEKNIKVAVVGLGYVGLPLSNLVAKKGFKLIGFDVDDDWLKDLKQGNFEVSDIDSENFSKFINEDRIHLTHKEEELKKADVILIAVPTPLDSHQDPDLSYVKFATKTISENISNDTLVVLESTTYPGATEEIIASKLKESSKQNIFIAYSPERLDQGKESWSLEEIPKVVGGINEKSGELATQFYELIFNEVHTVSDTQTAEMSKLLENIYRLVNISLINEMSMIADELDIDIWEVIEAAKTKPYGFNAFYPGLGAGGHCIPLDPFYLSWKAKEKDFQANFISLAGEINHYMPQVGANKVSKAMNEDEKPIKNSDILVLGIAYKKNLSDDRESSVVKLIDILKQRGGEVSFFDSYVQETYLPKTGENIKSLSEFDLQQASNYDCVVIGTAHDYLDYDKIADFSNLLVDFSNTVKKRGNHIYKF